MSTLDRYAELLATFSAYPSISTDPAYQPQVEKTAQALSQWLGEMGFDCEIITGYENPLVLARYRLNESAPTCLVYGHYDVQPAAQEDGWSQDPFTLTRSGDRLVARGAVDNKGQFLIHLAAIAELIREEKLAWNLEVLLEGNEETGSGGIMRFLEEHPEKITATTALVSDGEIHGLKPTMEIGFRGTLEIDIALSTSDRDLHSGLFGGTVPNSARELCRLLDTLYAGNGELAVAGISDGAHRPTTEERSWADEAFTDPAAYQELAGTRASWSDPDQTLGSQLIFRPAIEIIGLDAGYMGPGFRNSISGCSRAKLNVRLAPGQSSEQVYEALTRHFHSHLPAYATLELEHDGHCAGILVDATRPILRHTAALLEEAYGAAPRLAYCGASLPFLTGFQAIPNLDLIIIPLGNEDCLMHAVGENINLANVEKGLAFSRAFFSSLPR